MANFDRTTSNSREERPKLTAEKTRGRRKDQSDDDIFKSLTESAFGFLERAVNEFRGSPKFSTIHFAIAVELFLKARLMREHWSLIVDDADRTSKAQFLEGKSRTVTSSAALSRLRNIVGVAIHMDAERVFSTIFAHRNKMIHFVHEDERPRNRTGELFEQVTLEKVAMEQCHGWMQLQRLLAEWADHFAPWNGRADQIRGAMKGHREFLSAIFERVTTEIEAEKKKGIEFFDCDSCGFLAARVTPITQRVADLACMVCESEGTRMLIDCPNDDCGESIAFATRTGHPDCPKCQSKTDAATVAVSFDTDDPEYFDRTSNNCSWCHGYHSVIRHHQLYLCCECLEVGTDFGICEWCNEGQLGGDLDMSYYSGCEFCEGQSGWNSDN